MKILTMPVTNDKAIGELTDPRIVDVIWNFGSRIKAGVRPQLENAVESAITRYNRESNTLVLRRSDEADANCLKIDFSKGEFVSRRNKMIAYLVNFLGMIIMPAVGFMIGFPGPLVLNYFPRNMVKSELAISSSKQLIFKKIKKINAWTWVLFVNAKRKEDKLVTDYSERLYQAFKGLQMQNVVS
ncbi:hypothetical protein [Mucilaginibacter sp.]|jgi:hypothetical protein|uniref:hypothetical protein n=1 Tax=Mucilaginibacter sp. TaxID=1882438 RepID=UPI0035657323